MTLMTSMKRGAVMTMLMTMLCGALAATSMPTPAFAQPAPKPPSTGRELARPKQAQLSPEQAAKIVAEAIRMSSKDGACDDVVSKLSNALPAATTLEKAEKIRGYLAQQRCAIKTKRWVAVLISTNALLKLDPAKASPDEKVRALVELGAHAEAELALRSMLKEIPGAKRELMFSAVQIACRMEKWGECVKQARLALKEMDKGGAPANDESVVKTRIFLAGALIVTGDLKGYSDERASLLAALGPKAAAQLDRIDSGARAASERKMWLKVTPAKLMPLGTYHLMGKPETGVMAALRMVNHDARDRSFRLETEVQGATERSVKTFKAPRGKLVEISMTPPLQLAFDVTKIRAQRPAQLAIKLIETTGGKAQVLLDETAPLEVLPRDYLPTSRNVGNDHFAWTVDYMGAWITPNIKPVEEFLSKAKQRLANRTFSGEQRDTLSQVKAIYDELQSRGVTYVMDPNISIESIGSQRTRLPADVLSSTNAQCLEGTLLFATLLESIGLRPIIVRVPGHAFVGWWSSRYDQGKKVQPMFLETTLVGKASFEDAVQSATLRVGEELKLGNMANGLSGLTEVTAMRQRGFTPQPYE